jgi:hypothetical protein
MEKVLERILEKFDIFQRKVIEGDYPTIYHDFLMHFAGVTIVYCKMGNSFEVWYEDCVIDSMSTFSLVLDKDEVLTKEELEIYYKYTRDRWIRSSMGI